MPDDFYDLLDVPDDASQDDVKKAFREKVREYHPDLNDDPRAQAQFTALKKAYDTLGNPSERNAYDRMGHEDYVSKRIKGLPSQDKWATSSSSGSSSSSATASGSASRTKSRTKQRSSSTTQTSTTSSAGSTGASRSSTASKTGSASSGGRTYSSSRSAGERRSTSSGSTSSARTPSILSRVASIRIGWPGIVSADLAYLVAVALYATLDERALRSLGGDVRAAGTDVDAWQSLLLRSIGGNGVGLTTVERLLRTLGTSVRSQSVGDPVQTAAAVLLVLSMVALPVVYAVVIRRTRRSLSEWRPTRLYVLLALGPLLGVVADFAGYARVGVYLACFVVLPLLVITLLPVSAFVRPKVKRLIGWA